MMPKWGGNCYGMCVTADLFYLDMLNWDNYKTIPDNSIFGTFQYPNNYYYGLKYKNNYIYATAGNNSEITKMIERYQIFQKGTSNGYWNTSNSTLSRLENSFYRKTSPTKEVYEHISDGKYIQELYNMAISRKEPIIVALDGKHGGHAIILRDNISATYVGDGWYSFPVYDPNDPYLSDNISRGGFLPHPVYLNSDNRELYLELNPSKNKWRYRGAALANDDSDYYGCDSKGKIIYKETEDKDKGIIKYPDSIIFLQINNTDYPTSFHGDVEWTVNSDTDTIIYVSPESSFDIINNSQKVICSVSEGKIIEKETGVEYYQDYGYIESNGSTSGKITLPYKQFNIHYYAGNSISIIDNDSAINISCDKESSISANMNTNTITVSGEETSEIVAQITEVLGSEEYTSVSVDGTIDSNDQITIGLEDSELNINNQIDNDSEVSVYTKNASSPDERYIMALSNDNNIGKSYISDVRNDSIASGITGDCKWTLTNDGLLTISGNGKMGDYDSWSGESAPWGNNIKTLIVSNGVTHIGTHAFYNCKSLKSVSLPNSLVTIGNYAFHSCSSIESIIIPNRVTKIGAVAFCGCTNLKTIKLSEKLTEIGSSAFTECKSIKNIDLPSGIKTINQQTFQYCTKLESILLPEGLLSIDEFSFMGCSSLKLLTLPNSLVTINTRAFQNCKSLTEINIPSSVNTLGDQCFWNCQGLTRVSIPNSTTSFGESVFSGCQSLTIYGYKNSSARNYATNNQVPFIAFDRILTSIEINKLPTKTSYFIGETLNTSGLELKLCYDDDSISYTTSGYNISGFNTTSIGTKTLKITYEGKTTTYSISVIEQTSGQTGKCTWELKGTELTISGTGAMANYNFGDTLPWGKDITKVIIEYGVTRIGNHAFDSCKSLASISIPESVTYIGDYAFLYCTNLCEVTLPNSLRWIAIGGFDFSGLKEIVIPEGVTGIPDFAFWNCSNLERVYLPKSISSQIYSIGGTAFGECNNLTIYGYGNTDAKRYADECRIPFVDLCAKSGDVDGDGEVTILDATAIQRVLADLPISAYNEAVADTDGDGEVTILDATFIQRWLAGLSSNEKIGKPLNNS